MKIQIGNITIIDPTPEALREVLSAQAANPATRSKTYQRWANVDWSKSNAEIAEEVGRSPDTVSMKRAKLGAPRAPRTKSTSPIYDWDSVDWSQQNADIADQLGCSKQRVSHMRVKLGEARPARWHMPRAITKTELVTLWMKENMRWSGLFCARDVAQIHDTQTDKAYQAAKDTGFLLFNPAVRTFALGWPINWDLPNIDIARAWYNCKSPTWTQLVSVARQRQLLGKGRAKWDNTFGRTNGEPGRQQLFEAEVEKRKQWLRDAWREVPNRIAC